MCKSKMKVITCTLLIGLLATIVNADTVEKTQIEKHKEVVIKSTDDVKSKDKEVHKRGIFHNEGLGHYATYPSQFAQQELWPKSYAAQYGYSFRPVGPSFYRQKPYFAAAQTPAYSVIPGQYAAPYAHPYALRPGGASVSSYSATYPRYHARPAYTVPHVAPAHAFATAVAPVQPVASTAVIQSLQPLQPSYAVQAVQPVAAPALPPQQQHHYFVQSQFVPPPAVQAQVLPQYPPIAFAPESPTFVPSVPQIPAIPQVPPVVNVPAPPTPAPANVIFPFNFQPPGTQQPPAFGGFPVSVEFSNFRPVGQNPAEGGSAVASPQIPASPLPPTLQVPQYQPQPQPQPQPLPEPELPPIQSPPTHSQAPWRPIYSVSSSPPANQPRPPITLQPPYGAPSPGYLPPAASSQSQSQQVQQYEVHENYYDELSDADIANIFQQSKYVPHHSHHLQRQSGLVYQHHH